LAPAKDGDKGAKKGPQKVPKQGNQEGRGAPNSHAKPTSPAEAKGAQKKGALKEAPKEKAKPVARKPAPKKRPAPPGEEAPGKAQEEGSAAPVPSLRSSALGLGSLRGSALTHRRTTLAPLP